MNNTDPSGHYTKEMGNAVHEVIGSRYWQQHPLSTINPTTFVFGNPIKPDILNPSLMKYAEIKPLSFKGITLGYLQMEAYGEVLKPLGFTPETHWPNGFQTAFVQGHWIVYFNVEGIVFYSDAVDEIKELKRIANKSSAYRAMRNLVSKSLQATLSYASRLGLTAKSSDNARLESHFNIATLLGTLGGL